MVEFSHAKANSYVNLLSTNQNSTLYHPDNLYIPIIRDDVFYYAGQVGIGTPPRMVWLMIDTGGGLIWTQCQPCINCFNQDYAIFDPRTSSTYQRLPCNHYLCSGPNSRFKCVDEEYCVYDARYGGGRTKGIASLDSLVFKTMNGPDTIMSRIIFGCSDDNQNFLFAERGLISGILGLNLSPESLINQIFGQSFRRFSYCMAPLTEGLARPLYLRFADDVPQPGGVIHRTPFATGPAIKYYMLNLLDISINSHRLNFPPDTFRKIPSGATNGFVIDAGAPNTMIDQRTNGGNAYRVVMTTIMQHYDSFGLQKRNPPTTGPRYQLCYYDKPGFHQHPTMTFHFQEADYLVEGRFMYIHFDEGGFFCITILPGNGVSILGAHHQQNMRIIYDCNVNELQFYPINCIHDQVP
ncbi:hypothetical protein LWI29_028086 [Acer saccharum]|uniref:Peptidase A1 domain-containing protein n=1 Tax=Acer saccharum TaxID=4024 RepID=A0AA39VXC7_ACESA|nr:hypothetical protein LWI29_028086 [Acer saccharum]